MVGQYGMTKVYMLLAKIKKEGDEVMGEVYLRTIDLPSWLADKYFYGKDIISVEDLVGTLEDLDSDYDMLEEKFEDFKRDVEDNYKPLSMAEQVGIDDRDFYDERFLNGR